MFKLKIATACLQWHPEKWILVIIFASLSIFVSAQLSLQDKWIHGINQEKLGTDILELYHPNAGIDYDAGFFYSRTDIYTSIVSLKHETGKITDLKIDAIDIGNDKNKMEIGSFHSLKSNSRYYYVAAWRYKDGAYLKEMEYIYPSDNKADSNLKGIDSSRKLWVSHSNDHSAQKLVEEVYTQNSKYFNRGNLSMGRTEITRRYAYMNGEGWSIQLNPVETIIVNENTAFEIGTYVSNGKGQYMLIWQKDPDEVWRVQFDFNF